MPRTLLRGSIRRPDTPGSLPYMSNVYKGPGHITENDPDAIEMSNAAYGEMFSTEKGYPQRSPVADGPTPGGMVQSRLAFSKRQLQDKVDRQRTELIKQGRAQGLNNRQINEYLQKLSDNAQRKAMELTQKAETDVAGLAEIAQVGKIGGMNQETILRNQQHRLGLPTEKPAASNAEVNRITSELYKLRAEEERYVVHPAGTASTYWGLGSEEVPREIEVHDPTQITYRKDSKGRDIPVYGKGVRGAQEGDEARYDQLHEARISKERELSIAYQRLRGGPGAAVLQGTALSSTRMAAGGSPLAAGVSAA
ncbi:hypothetical protein LCGC14_2996340, partial [marine sediment metagenome]